MSTTHKILSNILLSRLAPHAEEIIGDHQCRFRRNRSATGHIFCTRPILQKKWKYDEAVHQLFVYFMKAYNSIRREVFYNILIVSAISVTLTRLMKMCLNETYGRVRIGPHLSDTFLIRNSLKQGDALSPLL